MSPPILKSNLQLRTYYFLFRSRNVVLLSKMYILETLYFVFTLCLHLGGTMLNLLLICAIIIREAAQSQSYNVLMLANAVTDTLMILMTVFVNPR